MGCGGGLRDRGADTPRTSGTKFLSQSMENRGKLPLVVLEGLAKALHIPLLNPYHRSHSKPKARNRHPHPFANAKPAHLEIMTQDAPSLLPRNQSFGAPGQIQSPSQGGASKPSQNDMFQPLDPTQLQQDSDTEPLLNAAKGEESGAHTNSTPAQLLGEAIKTEDTTENLQKGKSNAFVHMTEQLTKYYNQSGGISPLPSAPVEEDSDEEAALGADDENRRISRLAKEKAAESEAARIAAGKRAEAESLLSVQSFKIDEQKSQADAILSKYQ